MADVSKPLQDAAEWVVEEGVLDEQRRARMLADERKGIWRFVLEYEFRLGPRGNSGLALRAPLRGDPAFDGMEMQMADFRTTNRLRTRS